MIALCINVKKPPEDQTVLRSYPAGNAVSQVLSLPCCKRDKSLAQRAVVIYLWCPQTPSAPPFDSFGTVPLPNLGFSLAGFTAFHLSCRQESYVSVALSAYSGLRESPFHAVSEARASLPWFAPGTITPSISAWASLDFPLPPTGKPIAAATTRISCTSRICILTLPHTCSQVNKRLLAALPNCSPHFAVVQ